MHERGVDPGNELRQCGKPPSHQAGLRPGDQRLHLRMAAAPFRSFHEDQPMLLRFRSALEFALSGRDPLGILTAVVPPEQPHVDIAPVDFVHVHSAGPPVGRRHFLKETDLEEMSHEGIAAQIVAQVLPLERELLLDAADEDADRSHGSASPSTEVAGMGRRMEPVRSYCITPCLIARVLSRRCSSAVSSASMSERMVAMARCSHGQGSATLYAIRTTLGCALMV